MASLLSRRVVGVLSSLLLAAGASAVAAAPAHAEDGYQYWNYFHLEDGAWAFSQVGPADFEPQDGAVEGFRYGVSTPSQGIEPRADLAEVDFDAVCADADAGTGEKRVAVLIDYGTVEGNGSVPEPRGACAVVPEDATSQQVLDEVSEVRVEGGMTCALDGYPASGCGEPVPNAEVPADEEPVAFALPGSEDETEAAAADQAADEDGAVNAIVVLAALVVVIAVLALVVAQRRKRA